MQDRHGVLTVFEMPIRGVQGFGASESLGRDNLKRSFNPIGCVLFDT
jgi:hypothetical protein